MISAVTDDNDAPAGPTKDAGGLPDPESDRGPAPVLRTCLNCGTIVELAYCPKCGQHYDSARELTISGVLYDVFEKFVTFDSKMITSLGLLVAKPGFLTNAYLSGRRVPYLGPARTFVLFSVVFFLLMNH
jgi:hypothetical protein